MERRDPLQSLQKGRNALGMAAKTEGLCKKIGSIPSIRYNILAEYSIFTSRLSEGEI